MGGRRLGPGEAVQAFEEAIDVIRGIWDVSERSPLRAGGEFHRVDGAKREGIAEGNAIIDAEAVTVGRDPREIRRLVNFGGRFQEQRGDTFDGPPAAWVGDIADLALADGVGTFILATDDPAAMETFARDVIPEVRSRVTEARV